MVYEKRLVGRLYTAFGICRLDSCIARVAGRKNQINVGY